MIFAALALLLVPAAVDPDCQSIIDAHSQTLGLIRTLQIEYKIVWISKPNETETEIVWRREGDKERISRVHRPDGPAEGKDARNVADVVIADGVYKALHNWDSKYPRKITPTRQQGVTADISPRTGVNPFVLAPAEQFRFEVDAMPRRTLSELAKVSPQVKCEGKVELEGREAWLIKLESPERTSTGATKRHYEVYLDPAAGYLIRKVVIRSTERLPDGKVVEDAHAHEVTEFKDFGNGVFVPMRVRNGTLDFWGTEFIVTSVKVNEPIAAETFEMKWPKFVLVRHLPGVNRVIKFDVWGDDEPLASFEGVADLRAFEAGLRKDPVMAAALGPEFGGRIPPPPSTSTITKLAIAFGVLLVVMVALVIRRRIREQAAA